MFGNVAKRTFICMSGLCRIIWKYFQLQQNCLYDVLRLRVQKAQSPHYWHMGGKNIKYVNQHKYVGAVLDTELSDNKDIQRQLW